MKSASNFGNAAAESAMLKLLADEAHRPLARARDEVNTFADFCFRDAGGRHLRQALLHRELQDFLSNHRHALVELPRDHGKSVQICLRILWELGRNPNLRVKIVCASDALAAERSRFLRDAIRDNGWIRQV